MRALLNFLHLTLFSVSAGVGLAITALLTWAKYSEVLLPCSNDFQCEEVLSSPWSSVFGVPVSVLGVLANAAIVCFSAIAIKNGSASCSKFALRISTLGLVASIVFTSYAHFILRAHCVWCLTSGLCFAVSTFALATNTTKTGARWIPGGELVLVGVSVIALGVSFDYRETIKREAEQPACDVALAAAAPPAEVVGDKQLQCGASNPKFSVVLYVDFQCQSCHNLFGPLQRTVERKGGELVVRHFPISSHEYSFDVATAICALGKGGAQETARLMNKSINKPELREFADRIKQQFGAQKWQLAVDKVNRDRSFAISLGARSTPGVLIIEGDRVTAVSATRAIDIISRL